MRSLQIAAAFLIVVSSPFARPQTAPYVPTLTFDVTSVRECPPGPHNNGFKSELHNGRLTGTGVWASQLIGWAYGVDYRVQVLGGPDWVQVARSNEVRFDVQASSSSETDDKLAKLSDDQTKLEKQHMIQVLLEGRFGLKAHLETREAPAFALTVARHGTKLEKGEPIGPNTGIDSDRDARGIALVAQGATTAELANMLQFYLRKRVIDQTGITGTFKFRLQFHGSLSDMETDDGSMWPPMETAIQEQLGLQLKDAKAPIQVVVIDHIEMPSPN